MWAIMGAQCSPPPASPSLAPGARALPPPAASGFCAAVISLYVCFS